MIDPRVALCICRHNARLPSYQVNSLVLFCLDFAEFKQIREAERLSQLAGRKAARQPHFCYHSPCATEKDQVSKLDNSLLRRRSMLQLRSIASCTENTAGGC